MKYNWKICKGISLYVKYVKKKKKKTGPSTGTYKHWTNSSYYYWCFCCCYYHDKVLAFMSALIKAGSDPFLRNSSPPSMDAPSPRALQVAESPPALSFLPLSGPTLRHSLALRPFSGAPRGESLAPAHPSAWAAAARITTGPRGPRPHRPCLTCGAPAPLLRVNAGGPTAAAGWEPRPREPWGSSHSCKTPAKSALSLAPLRKSREERGFEGLSKHIHQLRVGTLFGSEFKQTILKMMEQLEQCGRWGYSG